MKNKYPKEWGVVEVNPEMGGVPEVVQEDPEITEGYNSTMADMATVIPQGMTFDHADELIEVFSPDMANDYREIVAAARKNSPNATLVSEIFTPDALSLLGAGAASKGSKIAKLLAKLGTSGKVVSKGLKGEGKLGSLGQDVATSVAQQHGESGDVGLLNTAASTGLSQGMKGVGRAIFGDTEKIRAGYTGLRDKTKDMQARAYGTETGEDLVRDSINRLDEYNFLQGGKHTFDPVSLKFEPATKLARAKGKLTPPSLKEMIERANSAKKTINDEMEKIINENEVGDMANFVDPEFSVSSGRTLTWNRDDVEETLIAELLEELPDMTASEIKKIEREAKHQMNKIFDPDTREANIRDLITAKRKLYERTDFTKESDALGINLRKKLAAKLNSKIDEAMPDPRFKKLNKMYGDMAQAQEAAMMHKDKKFMTTKEFKAQYGAVSPVYGAASYIQDKLEPISRPVSQIYESAKKSPLGEQMLSQPIRKGPADLFSSPEQGPQEMPISEEEKRNAIPYAPQGSLMPASERMEMNLPKEIIKTKMPRNPEGLVQNGKIFKYKVAQEARDVVMQRMAKSGVDPSQASSEEIEAAASELYNNVKMVIDESPEQVAKILPIWIQEMPQMFEDDRYGRISNVVPQKFRMDVSEEIRKNKSISNIERVSQLGKLNSSGEYSWDLDNKGEYLSLIS